MRQAIQITIELTHPKNKIESLACINQNGFWLRGMNFWVARTVQDAAFNLPGKKSQVKILVNGKPAKLEEVRTDPQRMDKSDALFRPYD